MKLTKFLLLAIAFFTSVSSFSQATSTGSTLTVTDLTGNYVFYEYNFTSTGGFISEYGPGAPLNTPIKIKLSSSSGYIPTFYTGDLNGNCDSYQVGSMNSANTEFTTTLNSCCPSIAELKLSNGLKFWITIKCAPVVGTGTNCVTSYISYSCNLYCISFFLPSNAPVCRTKNYTVVIGFTDGTSTTIIVNFASNNTMFCFAKPINNIISSNFSNCQCGESPLQKQSDNSVKTTLNEKAKIHVFPNPTNSIVRFTGENIDKLSISIYDSIGQLILRREKIDTEINLEMQKKGVYIYIIEDGNGFKQEGKLIRE